MLFLKYSFAGTRVTQHHQFCIVVLSVLWFLAMFKAWNAYIDIRNCCGSLYSFLKQIFSLIEIYTISANLVGKNWLKKSLNFYLEFILQQNTVYSIFYDAIFLVRVIYVYSWEYINHLERWLMYLNVSLTWFNQQFVVRIWFFSSLKKEIDVTYLITSIYIIREQL